MRVWARIIIKTEYAEINAKELSAAAEKILEEYFCELSNLKKRCFIFHIFIEPDINYSKQREYFSRSGNILSSDFSCHINFNKFIESDDNARLSLILTSCYLLLNYWVENYSLPTDVNIEQIRDDVKKHLIIRNYYELKTANYFFKPTNNTRFIFLTTIWHPANRDKLSYDLRHIESFLINYLMDKDFGSEIKHFYFGYELFSFTKTKPSYDAEKFMRYGHKHKEFTVARIFDYDLLIILNKQEQWLNLKNTILESLDAIKSYKRIPKNFDLDGFTVAIKDGLSKYEKKYCA